MIHIPKVNLYFQAMWQLLLLSQSNCKRRPLVRPSEWRDSSPI